MGVVRSWKRVVRVRWRRPGVEMEGGSQGEEGLKLERRRDWMPERMEGEGEVEYVWSKVG